jgi:hypothetical protein
MVSFVQGVERRVHRGDQSVDPDGALVEHPPLHAQGGAQVEVGLLSRSVRPHAA